ncbi:Helix-turn-helix [Salinimicrobium sediminis]|uniref:Helix-turn-helix n=1 Tax=Salinimicrobium sediminis TaxID=1343891 RepID=A0A285X3D3_9FLAO|nr:helix-turn-helix transcriptional regulator [Salinimicrobium sediminis]SOC79857.1 Helix-turn-helix [Salinimicrobium sediminis]
MQGSEIKELRKRLRLSQTEFGKLIGASLRSVQNYEKGNTQPSADVLLKLLEVNEKHLAQLKDDLAYLKDKVDPNEIKVNQPLENFQTKAGSTYEELPNGKYKVKVPFVPVKAQARYLHEFTDAEFMSDLEEMTFFVDRVGNGKYLAFEIQNDSMDDGTINSIPDGAVVLARELGKQHWTNKFHTHSFPYWIIVHKTTILCKEILNHDIERGVITCHSLNESPEYSDFELKLDDVHQLFNIVKKTF